LAAAVKSVSITVPRSSAGLSVTTREAVTS
jgi:hypothetical protein